MFLLSVLATEYGSMVQLNMVQCCTCLSSCGQGECRFQNNLELQQLLLQQVLPFLYYLKKEAPQVYCKYTLIMVQYFI